MQLLLDHFQLEFHTKHHTVDGEVSNKASHGFPLRSFYMNLWCLCFRNL